MAGTLLTTTAVTTMVPAASAGEDNDDGNQQIAEDDSSARIADCDRNDVEEARFLCIAIAANDVETEPPEESANDVETEPPEESATLSVCKDVRQFGSVFSPEDFTFTVTGNSPSDDEFAGDHIDGCVDVTIGPGEYSVSEVSPSLGGNVLDVRIEGDCEQDPIVGIRATGEIQAGETQECRFINSIGD
jgi:hypothetical protein